MPRVQLQGAVERGHDSPSPKTAEKLSPSIAHLLAEATEEGEMRVGKLCVCGHRPLREPAGLP